MILIPTLSDDTFERLRALSDPLKSQSTFQQLKALTHLSDWLSEISMPVLDNRLGFTDAIADSLKALDAIPIPDYSSQLRAIVAKIDFPKLDLPSFDTSYLDRLDLHLPDYHVGFPSAADALFQASYEAIRAGREYLSEEQEDLLDEIDPAILTAGDPPEAPAKRLSLSNLLAILGILITLYFGILQSLPDEQLDKLIAQNRTIIEQNQAQIEQNQAQIEQKSREIELLQQISDAQQQILNFIEENQDAFVELDDGFIESEQLVQVDDDLVNLSVDDSDFVNEEDSQQQPDAPSNDKDDLLR